MLALINGRTGSSAALLAFILSACREITPPVTTGTIAAVVRTSGGDLDTNYELVVGNQVKYLFGDGSVAFRVAFGAQVVTLNHVAENCTVAGPTSVPIDVPQGKTIEVIFSVSCAATGLEITTVTTGSDTPNDYQLKIGVNVWPIDVRGKLLVTRLAPGPYRVELSVRGDNCSVRGASILTVDVANRTVTPVRFEIECIAPDRPARLAFHKEIGISGVPNEIFVVDPDGSGETFLASGQNPAWSPDGQRLGYSATFCDWYYGCFSQIEVIDPETRRVSSYPFTNHRAETPAWSPDGEVIAYIEFVNEALYFLSPNSGTTRNVGITGATRVREPSWSPDSKKIALSCLVASGDYDICTINRDGSGLVRVVQRPSVERKPSWSPDGTTIAFTIGPSLDTPGDIALVPADGGNVTIVTQGDEPSWSRDGRRLIFSRADGLFAIDPDGTNLTRLTTGKHRAGKWRP